MSQIHTAPISLNANAPDFTPSVAGGGASLLVPGEVVGSSGKFSQPTKIPGKNYFKVRRLPTRELVATSISISVSQDEVVIRNADSGKVMGLKGRRVHMIEQLTETVVSFQRLVVRSRSRRQCGTVHHSLVRKSLMAEVLVSLPAMMGVVSLTVLLLASRSLCAEPWPCEEPLFLTNITCDVSPLRVPRGLLPDRRVSVDGLRVAAAAQHGLYGLLDQVDEEEARAEHQLGQELHTWLQTCRRGLTV